MIRISDVRQPFRLICPSTMENAHISMHAHLSMIRDNAQYIEKSFIQYIAHITYRAVYTHLVFKSSRCTYLQQIASVDHAPLNPSSL